MNDLARVLLVLFATLAGAYCIAVLERFVLRGERRPLAAILAPAAHGIALLRQQSRTPPGIDSLLLRSAPLLALSSAGMAALVIPLGPRLVGFDPALGLFFFMAVLSLFVIAMMNAGWSQNRKGGVLGCFRAGAHLIAYEVPLGFAAIGPVMAAESFSTVRIVEAQSGLWYAAWQPLGVAIYLVAALIMCYRHPFDIPQAGSEIEGGVLAEYSGARLLIFRAALHAVFLLAMAMGVVLFFGGWHGPLLPGPAWFVLKTFMLAATVLWASRFFPRLRQDQMLGLAWKILLPASLVNVTLVGILALVIPT